MLQKCLLWLSCFLSVQFIHLSYVRLFVTPWPVACQASLSIINSWSVLKLMFIESVLSSNHLILCHPLLPVSIFPSIRVFSNESVLCIRWPKYWSFSFSISPSNEYSGLISFRMGWLDFLAVQRTLKSLLQHHSSKASILWHSVFFIVQLWHPYMTTGKTIALTRWTVVGQAMSLLFNMQSRLVIEVEHWIKWSLCPSELWHAACVGVCSSAQKQPRLCLLPCCFIPDLVLCFHGVCGRLGWDWESQHVGCGSSNSWVGSQKSGLLLGSYLSKSQPWPLLYCLDCSPDLGCLCIPRSSIFSGPGCRDPVPSCGVKQAWPQCLLSSDGGAKWQLLTETSGCSD